MRIRALAIFAFAALSALGASGESKNYSPFVDETYPMELLWGDTHVHTSFSMDANSMGNTRLGPSDAYRFAKGEVVTSNTGQQVRLDRPLDFLVVSDHAEYMGVLPKLRAQDPLLLADPAGSGKRNVHDPIPTLPALSSQVWHLLMSRLLNGRGFAARDFSLERGVYAASLDSRE